MSAAAFAIVVVGLVVIWLVFVRPARRRQREALERQERIQEGIVPGTEVITAGGMFGTIASHPEDGVVAVEIADGVVVRVDPRAIVDVVTPRGDEPAADGT